MDSKESTWVEVASFAYLAEGQILRSLLESENIACFLKDELMSGIFPGVSTIGSVKIQVKREDLPKVLEIMQQNGYERDIEIC